jgi:hypothetical protein
MPRYRFSWSNVDPGLKRALCSGTECDSAAMETELRSLYGVRPKEGFVAEKWQVLLDEWLAADGAARAGIVSALRSRRLGDVSIVGNEPEQQMSYLRTCRNHQTLRKVVLTAFIEMGERLPSTKPDRAGMDWAGFGTALSSVLRRLVDNGTLILSVRGTGATRDDADQASSYFVQFAGQDGALLRAEAVSNSFLTDEERLSPEAQTQLVQLGWQPPTHLPGGEDTDPTGSPNYYREFEQPIPFDKVARMSTATLEQIFNAPSPIYIQYTAFDEGGPIELPELALEPAPTDGNSAAVDPESLLPTPANPEELKQAVARAVVALIGGNEIVYDEDGDIPIRFGTAQVYVRSLRTAPAVQVFGILVANVRPSTALLEVVNDLNRQFPYATIFWDGNALIIGRVVPGSPFVAAHLMEAISMIGRASDEVDEDLQKRFGGRTANGSELPAPPERGPAPGYL